MTERPNETPIPIPAIRVRLGEHCGKRGCGEDVIYKVELPHRSRLFCKSHAGEYLTLVEQATGWRYKLDIKGER